jgi:hypothetical protein
MTDTRTVEQSAASIDAKLAALPEAIQNAAAIYAQGLMAGMELKTA